METNQHATKKKKRVNEEPKGEIRKYLETNENGNTTFKKSMKSNKRSSKREEVYNNTGLPQEIRKSLKQPNVPPKGIRKRTHKSQSQQKR